MVHVTATIAVTMSNRKAQGKSRNQSQSQSKSQSQQQQQYQTQRSGHPHHQHASPHNQSFHPVYAAEPGYSTTSQSPLMYTQYPSTLPGQFLTAPGAYMSPHLQFPRPPTAANASPTSNPANYFQNAAHMQHMIPQAFAQQYVQSGVQQNPSGSAQMSMQGGYVSGATGQAVSGLPGYPTDAMRYARGMLGGIPDPHLVSKQPWGMNPLNPAQVTMMQQSMSQQNVGQTGSIEENVEKQIDKLSSRRPKRARRANYNLKPAVPGLDKTVGAALHNLNHSHNIPVKPVSHKPTSPRSRARSKGVPSKPEKPDSQSKHPSPSKSASNRSTSTKRSHGPADGPANETKPKKKRKRNPETTSHYRGVSWNKANKSWKACIKVKGKNIHIGYFGDDVDAAKAYDMIAQQYRGSSAKVNFPESRVEFSRAVNANVE